MGRKLFKMVLLLSRFIELLFFIILAISLSKSWKTNIFSLGLNGFVLIGSYSIAFLFAYVWNHFLFSQNIFFSILIIIISVLIAGYLAQYISIVFFKLFKKLQDDYFAIATLAFAEILLITISGFDFLGGAQGTEIIISNLDFNIFERKVFFFFLILVFSGVFLYKYLKAEKSFEKIIVLSISENETGINHLGIDTKKFKEKVFAQTSYWSGLTGGLMAVYYTFISPNDYTFLSTIPVLLFVVLGNYSVLKTFKMTILIYFLVETIKSNFWGLLHNSIGNRIVDFQDLFYGILLILSVYSIFILKKKKANA